MTENAKRKLNTSATVITQLLLVVVLYLWITDVRQLNDRIEILELGVENNRLGVELNELAIKRQSAPSSKLTIIKEDP